MPYNYTNGDGVAPLLVTEPNGATETVSILDQAVRQIKAYLNDPVAGPAAIVQALTLLVNNGVPGKVSMYAGTTAPSGYLMCNGAAYSRTTYAALFAVIGTNFGVGDGTTTFNVPNCPGRTPVGVGTSTAEGSTTWSLGELKGAESFIMTEGQMFEHVHSVPATASSDSGQGGIVNGVSNEVGVPVDSSPAGGSDPISIVQPSIAFNFIIKT